MTTLIGIKTSSGPEAIVLAADTQVGYEIEGKNITKVISKFRFVDDQYAMLFSGNLDKTTEAFFSYVAGNKNFEGFAAALAGRQWRKHFPSNPYVFLERHRAILKRQSGFLEKALEGNLPDSVPELEKRLLKYVSSQLGQKEDDKKPNDFDSFLLGLYKNIFPFVDASPVQRAIGTLNFWEFNLLNQWYVKRDESSEGTDLLVASSNPMVELYSVDMFGNVKTCTDSSALEYFSTGSGSPRVEDYLSEEKFTEDDDLQHVKIDNLDIGAAIDLARAAMRYAAKDPETGTAEFAELCIVTKEKGIDFYGDSQKRAIYDAVKLHDIAIKKTYGQETEESSKIKQE